MTIEHCELKRNRTGVWVLSVLVGICTLFSAALSQDQKEPAGGQASGPYKRPTLSFSFGFANPQSKIGLTSFWNSGPSGSLSFFVHVSRVFSLGVGADVSSLSFDESAFRSRYDTIAVQDKNIVLSNVYVGWRVLMMPSKRVGPFIGGDIGALRATEARYSEVVDSVRVTYYNVGGSTRFTFGLVGGLDAYVVRWLILHAEARAVYVHNDPDIGVLTFVRGGARLIL
jgi:hypothetical protein